jgi:hypothetical protein
MRGEEVEDADALDRLAVLKIFAEENAYAGAPGSIPDSRVTTLRNSQTDRRVWIKLLRRINRSSKSMAAPWRSPASRSAAQTRMLLSKLITARASRRG